MNTQNVYWVSDLWVLISWIWEIHGLWMVNFRKMCVTLKRKEKGWSLVGRNRSLEQRYQWAATATLFRELKTKTGMRHMEVVILADPPQKMSMCSPNFGQGFIFSFYTNRGDNKQLRNKAFFLVFWPPVRTLSNWFEVSALKDQFSLPVLINEAKMLDHFIKDKIFVWKLWAWSY